MSIRTWRPQRHAKPLIRVRKRAKRKTGRTSLETRPIPMLGTSQVANPKEVEKPYADIAVKERTLTEINARPRDKNAGNVARRTISTRYAGAQHERRVHKLDPELVASKLSWSRESLPRLKTTQSQLR